MAVALCTAAVAAFTPSVSAMVASNEVNCFDDIHYWVGEGTNRCAIVIDWSLYGVAKAWGYRWNGEGTNVAEIVTRIAREDPRLKVGVQGMTSSFVDLYFFGYDVNDNHPAWDMDSLYGACSDPEALLLREDTEYFSMWWVFYGPMNGTSFPCDPQTSSWEAANQVTAENNEWFVFSYGCPEYVGDWEEVPAYLTVPEPAESPYGHEVIEWSTTERKAEYNDPWNALGHPSACMDDPSVYWGGQNFGGVVNPANPAWGTGRLFTLSSWGDEELDPGEEDGPGYVTIAFDHNVTDDPANPFGLDFIVFGNAGINNDDGSYYNPGTDPTSYRFLGTGFADLAKVEVSQDGIAWHSDPAWRYADDFAPTLGHLYEPAAADPALFAGNAYWGRATCATKPVDPKIGFANCAGRTLADICNYYNGSAGGTGYDISNLPLEPDAQGRKWFRYVRISSVFVDDTGEGDRGYTEPEVDAVADVAPVSGYEKWVEANYTDWTTVWQKAVSGPEALAPNGKPNAVNYILGLGATESADACDFRIAAFTPGEDLHRITVASRAPLAENCGIVVKRADSPSAKARMWTTELPLWESAVRQDGLWLTTFGVATEGGAFFKLSLDLE